MATEYPKRPAFFAHKFVRKMAKVCLANDIGPEACWMLAIIAHTEDAKSYRGPVTFFNGQLFPLVGLHSVDSLDRARTKAVKAGWLQYEPGMKGKAGTYWVSVPKEFEEMDDLPTDESEDELNDQVTTQCGRDSRPKAEGKPKANRKQTGGKPKASAEHSSLIPDPIPSPNSSASGIPTQTDDLSGQELNGSDEPKTAPRPPDLLWDAIVEVTGVSSATAAPHIGRVKKFLLAETPPFTPEEVRQFLSEMPMRFPWAKGNLTLSFLQQNIGVVRSPLPSQKPRPAQGKETRDDKFDRIFGGME